jgi:hypothetical protein
MQVKSLVDMEAFGCEIKKGEIYVVDLLLEDGQALVNDFLLEPGEYEIIGDDTL